MEKQTERIAQLVKATDVIKDNLRALDNAMWSFNFSREIGIKYHKDIPCIMFSVIKIKEKAENIKNKMWIDTANSDYNPAYFFKDTHEAGYLVSDLHREIISLYECCKTALEKEDEPKN